ncbi:hypothetical protein SAMN04490179_2777 [Pseudomonas antarctica]|uniref:Uncharacterized protein n=1 Tax=Pseudomonas antarctica TaxID=219572 RepID=A0A1G9Z016_9PSED|nr:hypothetical protein PSAN_33540 [Pseudomonas antarctica]SDN14749.1 hypothetical protein SAMN04490179_2777 [Pseudomonas antarctica]
MTSLKGSKASGSEKRSQVDDIAGVIDLTKAY